MSDKTHIKGYVIVESVYPKAGFPSLFNTIGFQTAQILRQVYSFGYQESKEEYEFRGEKHKLQQGAASGWHIFLDMLTPGDLVKPVYTKELIIKKEYAGSKFAHAVPLLKVLNKKLEKKEWIYTAPLSMTNIGKDPIPHIKIYGNPRANFVTLFEDVPRCVGFYDVKEKQLKFLNAVEKERLIRVLVERDGKAFESKVRAMFSS